MWLVGPRAWTLVDVAMPMSFSAPPASAQPRLKAGPMAGLGQETPMSAVGHGAGWGAALRSLFFVCQQVYQKTTLA